MNQIDKYKFLKKLSIIILFISIILFSISLTISFLSAIAFTITLSISITLFILFILFQPTLQRLKSEINRFNYIEILKRSQETLDNSDNNNSTDDDFNKNYEHKYIKKKQSLTNNEKYFYTIIKKHFASNYEIRAQVPLISVIEKIKDYKNEYQNELFRVIDFGIFDKSTTEPLLLIEINDESHNIKKRQYRDIRVKEICNDANLELISFWTNYDNSEQYIVNRISQKLKK